MQNEADEKEERSHLDSFDTRPIGVVLFVVH